MGLDYECANCGFDVWYPVWESATSVLGLYPDHRFPGRCILVLREHHEALEDVRDALLKAFWSDAKRAGAAIKAVARADRVNYAVLGNTVPHVHCHLIPRVDADDPVPQRPPWEHPERQRPLPDQRVAELCASLAAWLGQ